MDEPEEWERKFLNPDDVSAWLEEPNSLNTLSYLVANEIHQHYLTITDFLRILYSDPRIEALLKEPWSENYTLQHSLDHIAERIHTLHRMAETLRSLSLALGKDSQSDMQEDS